MISHNEGTFISSFQRKTDHTGSRGRLCNELHPRPPFTQSRNATMNQARQIRAGTCDTKDAHINAEKTKEAWPSSRTWRLDTPSSSTEEKNWFLRFSHNWIAEDLLATFMSGAKIETVCFITVSILAFRQLYRTQERPPFPKFAKTPTDFAHRAKM